MSAFQPSKILVVGATGTIGSYITASILRAKPAFPSVSILTSPATASTKSALLDKWKSLGLTILVGDIASEADVTAALQSTGADTLISCVGRGALTVQLALLRLAEASGTVRWFLPSEYGTDIEHNEKSPHEVPHQVKLKVRAYAREHVRRMQVTYVVTGPYFDSWVELIPGGEAAGGYAVDKQEAYLIEGSQKIGFCTMWDVGKFVVATLHHPEASFGKALKVQSFVVSPEEVLAEFEKQSGAKWTVTRTPLDAIRALEAPLGTRVTLRRIWAEGGTLYDKNDNELLGVKPEDLDPLSLAVKKALEGGNANDEF